MDFKLTQEQQAIKDKAREFVEKECLPLESTWPLSDYDAPADLVNRLRKKFTEYGFRGLAIPKEVGGQGKGTLAKCLVFEQLKQSWVMYGIVVTWSAYLDPHPALYNASDYQKEKYLYPILKGDKQYHFCFSEPETGSDIASMRTTAVRDGDKYIINGQKRWSADPFNEYLKPDYILVYAVTDPGKGYRGISGLIVDFPSPGLKVLRVMRTIAPGSFLGRVCDLAFEDCVVPAKNLLGKENEGFRYGQDQLNRNRTVIAAGSVGVAQRCLNMAIEYAQQRVTFGKPLADRQAIQWMLADSAMEVHMGRMLVYHAAWKIDQGEDARMEAAMAKAYCPEMACRVIDHTIQILGGIGCLEENRLGAAYCYHRISRIAEGSAEMMRLTIAKCLLGPGYGSS
jgi:alkylation response protein AidB-like acyl-CoA dehydrogenase